MATPNNTGPNPAPAARPFWRQRRILGWAIYDWANSAFATTVMAGFFPIFFKQWWSGQVDANISTARLGLGNAAASLIIALAAPILGAVADRSGTRKRMLMGFTLIGVAATASLATIGQDRWGWAIGVYATAWMGFAGAMVFYDALLPQVAPSDRLDQVSSLGYSLGYLGGGLLFALNVAMTLKPGWFGLADATTAVRWSFVSVAVWWGGFALLTFALLPPDPRGRRAAKGRRIRDGLAQLKTTFGQIRQLKPAFIFLMAYWCYIDGVDTIVRMAVDYGMSLGFDAQDLLRALLITQFVGFPAALAFGQLGRHWGVRRSIYLALGIYTAVTIWGAMMRSPSEFYLLAAVIGLVQGGIQALSRSYFARLIPKAQSAEFFGFYNMLGKFAAIIGPVLMGASGLAVKRWLLPPAATAEQAERIGQLASRVSILSVLILFIAGAVLFHMAGAAVRRET